MIRAHKIRIYPNTEQSYILRQYVGGSRFVYNWCLERWKKWALDKETGLCNDSPNWLKLLKVWTREKPDWADALPYTIATYAVRAVHAAYSNHFRHGDGWPQFKKKGKSRDTFRSDNVRTRIRKDGRHVHIVGVPGEIRMAESLRIRGKILSFCVSSFAGMWYVSVQVELPDNRVSGKATCGVDVGMKTPAVCSDGTTLQFPTEQLSHLERRCKKMQRCRDRRKKGSRRMLKALLRGQRIQERINNIRLDRIHKFTSAVCKNHDTVVIEDLNAAGMHRNGYKNVRKGMHRSCMAEVLRQISYKAINLVVADRWYPSTQLCSNCGARQKMALTERTYNCPHCGLSLDRDLNAALNLSKYPGSQG